MPNARGNVPHITRLHCDVRHNDAASAIAMEARLREALSEIAARRGVGIEIDPYTTFGPVTFDPTLAALLRTKARRANSSPAT